MSEERDMEYDLLDRRHSHPLLFEREGKCHGVCSESDCNFQIDESCIHLPPQIHSHFHPQHPLSLKSNIFYCRVCGERESMVEGYRCDECMFSIYIKCAIATKTLCRTANGEYIHISPLFEQPLTLALSPLFEQPQQSGEEGIMKLPPYYCFVCELPIQSGSSTIYYFCSQCDDRDVRFHKECAELPLQLEISQHPHPLSLLRAFNDGPWPCHICRNKREGFIYCCKECKFFNIHISCLKSLNHRHNFTKLQVIIKFICGVCGEKSKDRSVFLCNICHMLVHQECAEYPLTLRIYEHQHHDLTYFNYYSVPDDKIHYCKLCGKEIDCLYAGYGCSKCNYFSHLKCAQRRCVETQSVAAEKENIERHDFKILHPHHKLAVFAPKDIDNVEYKVCDGCMKCLSDSDPSYGCGHCDFYLHEECAKLPTKIKSRLIHPHILTLISTPNYIFKCYACNHRFHGFAYECKTCSLKFDVRCASIQISFLHPNHQHPLYLYEHESFSDIVSKKNKISSRNIAWDDSCDACGKNIERKQLEFQCVKPYCKFHLDIRCATLPVKVRYRFDQHPLYLTFFEEEEGKEEYYCDICEEERKPGVWFYSCRKCSFEAHTRCALGEFPFVKSAKHESHRHPLNLVTKGNAENGKGCGACNNKFCSAFECGACKFDVHASGPCYDLQVLEGKLVFKNYNVFSRANQPYNQSIQNFTVKELGPFPPSPDWRGGKAWRERFFSSITAFVVHCDEEDGWIRCIQFQYLKNGELVWSSKHGKEEGTTTEVLFDYPDEYLVQIRGSYVFGRILKSLSIETNTKTYGPFTRKGNGDGTEIKSFGRENGENIIGIFGTIDEDDALQSIGFQYISTNE